MEILAAVSSHLSAAKSALIRAGIEMQKVPVPIQHGCKLLRMVADLDKIEQWLRTDDAQFAEDEAVHAKPRRSRRLRKKERQSQPAEPRAEVGYTTEPTPPVVLHTAPLGRPAEQPLPRGSKLIG